MSSLGSPSLAIERSARSQYAVVAAVLTILIIVPWCLPRVPAIWAALLTATTSGLACLSFWRIGWLGGRRAVRRALWNSEGEWQLFDQLGACPATLHQGSQVVGALVWLRFASVRGPREILLFGSDLTSDARRRLVARLRLQAGARPVAGASSSDLP